MSKTMPVNRFLFAFLPVACKPILARGSAGPTSAGVSSLGFNAIGEASVWVENVRGRSMSDT